MIETISSERAGRKMQTSRSTSSWWSSSSSPPLIYLAYTSSIVLLLLSGGTILHSFFSSYNRLHYHDSQTSSSTSSSSSSSLLSSLSLSSSSSWHNKTVIKEAINKVIVSPSFKAEEGRSSSSDKEKERNQPKPKKKDGNTSTSSDAATNKLLQLMSIMIPKKNPHPHHRPRRDLSPRRRVENNNNDPLLDTETPPCDTTLLRITKNEIGAAFTTVVNSLAVEYNLDSTKVFGLNYLFANRKNYGIELRKVCSSCRELLLQMDGSSSPTMNINDASLTKYCGTDVYGYDATFSALVTYPLNDDNQIKKGLLPIYVYSRPTVYDVTGASTGTNADFASVANLKKIDAVFGFIATMVKGYIGLSPDFMGYGGVGDEDEEGWIPRYGYIIRNSYVTATLPVWMKTKSYLQEQSNCDSDMANVAFYGGYSEGAYASISVAEGLRETLNIQPLRILAGGGPYKWSTEQFYRIFVNGIESETEFFNTNTGREFYPLLLGGSYSSTNTGVTNYDTNQDLFNPEFRNTGLSWIEDTSLDQTTINERVLQVVSNNGSSTTKQLDSIWNADILALFRTAVQEGVLDFCAPSYSGNIEGKTDQFCKALKENDLYETIMNVQYQIDFCHSTNDEIIFDANLPDDTVLNSNQYLTLLPLLSNDHFSAGVDCLTNEILKILGGFSGNDGLDQYIPQSFIDTNAEFMKNTNTNGGCPVPLTPDPTEEPTTMSPSAAPSASSSAVPSVAPSTSPSVEGQCEDNSKVRFKVPKNNGKKKNTKCKKIKEKDCGTEFKFKEMVEGVSKGKPQDFCQETCNPTLCCKDGTDKDYKIKNKKGKKKKGKFSCQQIKEEDYCKGKLRTGEKLKDICKASCDPACD